MRCFILVFKMEELNHDTELNICPCRLWWVHRSTYLYCRCLNYVRLFLSDLQTDAVTVLRGI